MGIIGGKLATMWHLLAKEIRHNIYERKKALLEEHDNEASVDP